MSPEWFEPKTIISIGSLCVGVFGSLFGILSFHWNRRESRLDALSKVLEPLVRSAQYAFRANTCRRTVEQLKTSFPDPQKAPEAVQRVNQMIDEYGELIQNSVKDFREAEVAFAARSFRFPDRIMRLVKDIIPAVSELGRLVNAGMFERADMQLAKIRDDYCMITKAGRGIRLAAPFESVFGWSKKREKKESDGDGSLELTQSEMDSILELVYKRATTQGKNSFAVHAPKKLLAQPDITQSDKVVDELKDSIFVIAFQDGYSKMMTFPELLVFVYNLIMFRFSWEEAARMCDAAKPTAETKIEISHKFSMRDILRPEMVKTLLSKIEFATSPSD